MKRNSFEFFVKAHKYTRSEGKAQYELVLTTGAGHKLSFKSDSADLFEGYPVGMAVGVKLFNPQTTLGELKGSESMEAEEETEEEEEEEETTEEE